MWATTATSLRGRPPSGASRPAAPRVARCPASLTAPPNSASENHRARPGPAPGRAPAAAAPAGPGGRRLRRGSAALTPEVPLLTDRVRLGEPSGELLIDLAGHRQAERVDDVARRVRVDPAEPR